MKKFLRIIYSNIPLKKYLFYILRNNFKIRENFYKHLWFEGFFSTNYLNKQFFIYSLPTIIENEIFDEKHYQTQLQTEWAIITSPKNLEKLASKYSKSLKLKPISGNQILINSKNRDEVN